MISVHITIIVYIKRTKKQYKTCVLVSFANENKNKITIGNNCIKKEKEICIMYAVISYDSSA